MATAIRSVGAPESHAEPCARPTFETVERKARHAFGAARHATEELTTDVVAKVGRHPLRAVGIATMAGGVAGLVAGFGFGRFARTRR